MKVLVSDKIDEDSLTLFKKDGINIAYEPDITPSRLVASISQYEGLIVRSRTKVTKEIIDSAVNLKVIGRVGSGYDNIDIELCKQKNIIVVNAPDANSIAVAELTIGLMLSLLRKFNIAFSSMKEGLWLKNELKGSELSGKTVGIVGYGHVGKRVGELVKAFGANVLIYSRSYSTCTLNELFERADIVTLHLELNEETKSIINKDLLEQMKPSSYIINTSRSGIVDEEALFAVLSTRKITGAALDVFGQEPLPNDNKFRNLENIILTPHIAASTNESLKLASRCVIEDVVKVLKGEKPINQIFVI